MPNRLDNLNTEIPPNIGLIGSVRIIICDTRHALFPEVMCVIRLTESVAF